MYEQHCWKDDFTFYCLLPSSLNLGHQIVSLYGQRVKYDMTDVMQQSNKVISAVLARGKTSKFKVS
jgi:hypothetical protein